MKTADEIRNIDFVKSTFGGYRQSDVELFLDEIADDVQRLQNENRELNRKCAELQRKIEDFQGSETSLQSILMSAQRLADSIVAEAKDTAEKVLEKAGEQATEILSDANTEAEAARVRAEAEATRILGEAVQKSNLLISGAEEKANNQTELYNKYVIKVAEFKADIIEKYKEQLELILSMPEIAPDAVAAPVFVAEPPVEEEVVSEEVIEDIAVEEPVEEIIVNEDDVYSIDNEIFSNGFTVITDDEE